MCTCTVIPLSDSIGRLTGFRLVTSRDEQRTRKPAERPSIVSSRGAAACWPTDADAGGTWVSATEHGVVLCLLNVNLLDAEPPSTGTRTRGEIIPKLTGLLTLDDVATGLRTMDLHRYRPFRLVAATREGLVDFRWDRQRLIETRRPLEPACFVSSGLGDHMVEPRLMLFETMFRSSLTDQRHTGKMQDSYHQHVWPQHEHLSVMMSREEARTTCITTVEATWERGGDPAVRMHFSDDDGEHRLSLHDLATTVSC